MREGYWHVYPGVPDSDAFCLATSRDQAWHGAVDAVTSHPETIREDQLHEVFGNGTSARLVEHR